MFLFLVVWILCLGLQGLYTYVSFLEYGKRNVSRISCLLHYLSLSVSICRKILDKLIYFVIKDLNPLAA